MEGYDVIGDIHGSATKLEGLLDKLGYEVDAATGAYRHPQRTVIFVGDLIDRGREQLRVLEIAKAMADAGTAQLVMGNHEFNAIAYATEWPARSGKFLRPRTEKNDHQHHAFLEQVTGPRYAQYISWFRSLPLWLELDGLRVVHACWHQPSMDIVTTALGGNRFTTDEIVAINPNDGGVQFRINLSGIIDKQAFNLGINDVLNGIAYDTSLNRLFVTGKRWPFLYQIELVQ